MDIPRACWRKNGRMEGEDNARSPLWPLPLKVVSTMSLPTAFKIDLANPFPHLSSAPTVEAVIHWQARATKTWLPDELKAILATQLPGYPNADLQHQHEFAVEVPAGESDSPLKRHQKSWQGFRLTHLTEPFVAQFTRNGLAFSRLSPYQQWESFSVEALRLWGVFLEIAAPEEIQRLGVRFINRIAKADFDNLDEYLNEVPSFSTRLPLNGFMYQSRFDVPGEYLGINVVKTMQPENSELAGLIIDIDVFTRRPLSCDDRIMNDYLQKMRWLKNLVFFELLTPQTIKSFE